MYIDHIGPHSIESLLYFFKYTFYAWSQLLGEDYKHKFLLDYMYMCMKIQNPHTYLEFHFANEIEKTLHNQLVR